MTSRPRFETDASQIKDGNLAVCGIDHLKGRETTAHTKF